MKKIMVKYTMEIPEDKFEKACKKAWISNKEMIKDLRQRAEINGRVSVHKFIDKIIGE